ncbi:MAG: hypothetical protein E3J72_15335 [Planctomycetota bacterium]|nr:MAG: hypothetical protein E3J72_15335 [Planctomycetota bacterium]
MAQVVGIRREDKNEWERRVPLTPDHVRELVENGVEVRVQTSPIRAFDGDEYEKAGAAVEEDISSWPVTFAVKEIPLDVFHENGVYIFFAHVHKGQKYNMPMLQKMLDLGCTLIDYERVSDASGRRLIFFGKHAGLAGAIETLRALGKRLEWEGINTPFKDIEQPHKYRDLDEAKKAVRAAGDETRKNGLPEQLAPLVIGIAGYGNTSRGAQEILDDCLPITELKPPELAALAESPNVSANTIYKVVFKEEDTVEPIDPGAKFDLQDFYDHPEKYRARFHDYVPHLTVMINCIYWEEKYPRLLTCEFVKELYAGGQPKLRVIGDVSADIRGGVECTMKQTYPSTPNYVYDPETGNVSDGVEGQGPVIMVVENLPCELPREASKDFGDALMPFIEAIADADYTAPFDELKLPPEIKKAVIAYQGRLTPDYAYIGKFLKEQ